MSRILVGPSTFGSLNAAPLDRLREAGFEVVRNLFGRTLSEAELRELLPGVTGLIAGLEPLRGAVLEQSNLRVISRCGAGVSNVDVEAARRLGIAVRSTPDAPTSAVAEVSLAAMLVLLRQMVPMNAALHQGQWTRLPGAQLEGRTVAVVGFGRIGQRVARLLLSFGANVIAVDPHVERAEAPIELASLADALPRADIVAMHASGDAAILGPNELRRMKRGALVLNGSRGGLIDEAALCEALESGHVAGAWIDVFSEEPYHGPLTQYPQVLLTPHIGSLTAECRSRMEMEAVDNLLEAYGRR